MEKREGDHDFMKTITIYNIKGGTGKTTTAKTVAAGLSSNGKRVLLIDLDPQGNSGKTFLFAHDRLDLHPYEAKTLDEKVTCFMDQYIMQKEERTICDIFEDADSVHDAIRNTDVANLDVIPSNLQLSLVDTKLRLRDGRQENHLEKAIRLVRKEYDCCIIDCSPVKSLLTVNAIYASDLVLIPMAIDDDSKQGLAMTLREIKALEALYDLDIDYRIVITMKQRTKLQNQTVTYLRSIFEHKLLNTVLCYQNNPITMAAQKRKTVFDIHDSHIANDYRKLLQELEGLL